MLNEAGNVGAKDTILVQKIEGKESESIRWCNGFLIKCSNDLISNVLSFLVIFVQACRQKLCVVSAATRRRTRHSTYLLDRSQVWKLAVLEDVHTLLSHAQM